MKPNYKGKLIGKGAFSKVYDNGETVYIITIDKVKEAIALFLDPSRHIPKIEMVECLDSGEYVYTMQKYEVSRSVIPKLKSDQAEIYRLLRKIPLFQGSNAYDRYSYYYGQFSNLPDSAIKSDLIDMLDAISNYDTRIGFEISPRNVAVSNGDLVLLDVFFITPDLEKVYRKRA